MDYKSKPFNNYYKFGNIVPFPGALIHYGTVKFRTFKYDISIMKFSEYFTFQIEWVL